MRIWKTPTCVLLAVLLLAAGCSSSNKGRVEGTKWSSIAATVKGQQVPDGALRLEFGSDGSLVYKAGPKTYTGKYSLGVGNAVTLHLDQDLAGRKVHVQRVDVSDNQLKMTDSDGTSLSFTKQ